MRGIPIRVSLQEIIPQDVIPKRVIIHLEKNTRYFYFSSTCIVRTYVGATVLTLHIVRTLKHQLDCHRPR